MYFEKHGMGKPILFLHGWGCDGSIFLPVVNRLNGYTCYLVDFVGFGKSCPPPQDGWEVADYVEDVKHFMEASNLCSVVIVAHSFGCRVAIMLAAKYPQLVDKMLFVAPAGLKKTSFSRWLKVKKYRLAKFFARVKGDKQPAPKHASADYLACSPQLKNTFVKVVNQDLSYYAKRIVCPVLVVNGKQDTATPISHARRLCKLIRRSQLVEIDGDHFAFFYSPTAFANTVKIFVE